MNIFSRLTGIDTAIISRIVNGKQHTVQLILNIMKIIKMELLRTTKEQFI